MVNRGSGDDARAAAMQLAYRLHQIERWRRVDVRMSGSGGANGRSIVVGSFPHDIAVKGRELDVTPNGVALIDDRIDRMLIAREGEQRVVHARPGPAKS